MDMNDVGFLQSSAGETFGGVAAVDMLERDVAALARKRRCETMRTAGRSPASRVRLQQDVHDSHCNAAGEIMG
jgi:hypothetical protein